MQDNITDTKANLQRIGDHLKIKSDELVVKNNTYQDIDQRRTVLTQQIDKSKEIQQQLHEQTSEINEKLLTRRITITDNNERIGKLKDKISDVVRERRERLTKERDEQRRANIRENHRTNQNQNFANA